MLVVIKKFPNVGRGTMVLFTRFTLTRWWRRVPVRRGIAEWRLRGCTSIRPGAVWRRWRRLSRRRWVRRGRRHITLVIVSVTRGGRKIPVTVTARRKLVVVIITVLVLMVVIILSQISPTRCQIRPSCPGRWFRFSFLCFNA